MGWEGAKQIHNFCFTFALPVDLELLTNSHVLRRKARKSVFLENGVFAIVEDFWKMASFVSFGFIVFVAFPGF
jgi:hypothetical protein